MMKKNSFTLLEVLSALVVLALGLPALLWQLSTAVNRTEQSRQQWEAVHELTQAAEYLLLHGPGRVPDDEVLSGEYRVEVRYLPPGPDRTADRSGKDDSPGLRRLYLAAVKDGEVIEELELDCWGEDE